MTRDDKLVLISDILNGDSKANSRYWKIGKELGVELNTSCDIFHEIEEYILDKFEEMDAENNEELEEDCAFCGGDKGNYTTYCSKECSDADNTEGV
jgi:hypothetical protein